MGDISHISYRRCSKNLSEDRSSEQLSLPNCAERAISERSSYSELFQARAMGCSPCSPKGQGLCAEDSDGQVATQGAHVITELFFTRSPPVSAKQKKARKNPHIISIRT